MKFLSLLAPLAFLCFVSPAGAALYQSPPDFAHPHSPHFGDPRFSPIGGQEDRPILVIYARWDDVDYPADFDGAAVARRFFGTGFPSTTFPSVGDYFRRLSFNDLFLFPAAETQGTLNDGVVQVTVPGTKADFFTLSPEARNKRLLELADPFVDYSSFDSDGSGSLSNLEIVVNALEAEPELPLWRGCGITRGVNGVTLDGTNLGGLAVAMNNTATNLITIIHENTHVALGMIDLYGFDVGNFDIGAATCGGPDSMLFAPSAWYKLHWGWITPTVVTQDGYYDVRRADTTGDAFILYDPGRGTNDYFLVENRRPTPGTYDRGVVDDGLIIWRVADAALGISVPIGLMRPQPWASAWNAADTGAPQRTMFQPWTDGTPTTLAVRAIGAAGEVMRAYFDVRGPGVLVDTYPLDAAGPVKLTAGGSTQIDVPLMNTDEVACDTFVVEPQLPPAWTSSPGARILCAGETSVARITIAPDVNAAVGVHTIAVRGRSQTNATVVTDSPLVVEVLSVEGTILHVEDELVDLIATAPTSDVRAALQGALDELIGEQGGASSSGALDKLAADQPVSAITKLRNANSRLLLAEALGAGDLGQLEDSLGLGAEAIAATAYEEAVAAVGTPNQGEERALQRLADLIAVGRAFLQADQHVQACEAFRQATAGAMGLAG